MTKTLYVGNLPWSTTDQDLHRIFASHAEIHSVRVIVDRETGRSRGFGFVEVPEGEAEKVALAMNGFVLSGRPLVVNEAQPRPNGQHQM